MVLDYGKSGFNGLQEALSQRCGVAIIPNGCLHNVRLGFGLDD